MGQLINTLTITQEQLEALKIYAFCVNAVKQARSMYIQAINELEHAKEWMEICGDEIETALNLIPENLKNTSKQFEIIAETEEQKHYKALELIDLYFDSQSCDEFNSYVLKKNVIVRK